MAYPLGSTVQTEGPNRHLLVSVVLASLVIVGTAPPWPKGLPAVGPLELRRYSMGLRYPSATDDPVRTLAFGDLFAVVAVPGTVETVPLAPVGHIQLDDSYEVALRNPGSEAATETLMLIVAGRLPAAGIRQRDRETRSDRGGDGGDDVRPRPGLPACRLAVLTADRLARYRRMDFGLDLGSRNRVGERIRTGPNCMRRARGTSFG